MLRVVVYVQWNAGSLCGSVTTDICTDALILFCFSSLDIRLCMFGLHAVTHTCCCTWFLVP
jgi:hypothetical protein